MSDLVDVTAAQVVGAHRLRLTFSDGAIGEVDFSSTLRHQTAGPAGPVPLPRRPP